MFDQSMLFGFISQQSKSSSYTEVEKLFKKCIWILLLVSTGVLHSYFTQLLSEYNVTSLDQAGSLGHVLLASAQVHL